MESDVPGVRQARYLLLGLQAIPHDDGVIVRRGAVRVFIRGNGVGELLDLVVTRSAEGHGVRLEELKAEIDAARHPVLTSLVDTLRAERLLLRTDEIPGGNRGAERREEVFYWNHGTDFATVAENLADVELAVFGVNHIALPLLGNLRSVGFRRLTFVDHPALRNLDFYDESQQVRPEIASALSNRPQSFDGWSQAGGKADCYVVCSDFGGMALMRDWNKTCVANDMLFYPIVLQDEVAYLGPLVVPHEGPCFECLWARQNSNLDPSERERATEMHAFFGQHVASYLQPMARIAADIAAIDLLKYFSRTLAGGRAGRLIEADLMAPAIRTRNILKVPRCPVCSRLPAAVAEASPGSPA
jgi:bacteriocin biosynthesis cyclodehydratase domain-containing protein